MQKATMSSMSSHGTEIALAEAPLGQSVRIRHLTTHPDVGLRLRELGIGEDTIVRCLHRGYGNVICQVLNTRVAIDLDLAGRIMVSHID
jgi:Fe2+ transport system protein FeoA